MPTRAAPLVENPCASSKLARAGRSGGGEIRSDSLGEPRGQLNVQLEGFALKFKALWAASAAALALSAPAVAQDDHDCLDAACTMLALFAAPEAGGGAAAGASVEAQRMGAWGIDTAGMDTAARPGADFFAYVNGAWARNTPIPGDRSSYGAFALLRDLSEARVRRLVESYRLGNPATDGDQAKVAALYRSFMDEEAVERLGAQPLQPLLEAVRAIETREQMAESMGRSVGTFGRGFFNAAASFFAHLSDIRWTPFAIALGFLLAMLVPALAVVTIVLGLRDLREKH